MALLQYYIYSLLQRLFALSTFEHIYTKRVFVKVNWTVTASRAFWRGEGTECLFHNMIVIA